MTSDCLQPEPSVGETHSAQATMDVSATLSQIWQDILRIPHVEPTDDFFELGGDSLGAIRMLERIGRVFGDELLEPDVIYTASRLNDLAAAITAAQAQQQAAHS